MYATELQTAHNQQQHPVLRGTSGYRMDSDHLELSIEEIVNLRPEGDLSGTLSLELWALDQPYGGGYFEGFAIAGTQAGQLFGQHYIANSQYRLDFQVPPVGSWYMTLMLREWNGAEFVTRDFINFCTPYVVMQPAVVTQPAADNAMSATSNVVALKPAAVEQSATPTAAAKTKGSDKAAASGAVSINRATADELKAVKGMPTKLAESIVAARPYRSLDALLDIKGMGPKLLEKLRRMLQL